MKQTKLFEWLERHGTAIVVVCAVIWVLSLILILNQDAVAQWLVNHRIANP